MSYDRGMRVLQRPLKRVPNRRGPGSGKPDYLAHMRHRRIFQTYSGPVTSTDVRRTNLSKWAVRVFGEKRALEDWSVRDLAKAAGVGKDLIYSLMSGDWEHTPKSITIEKICDNLGIPSAEPLAILGHRPATDAEPEPVRSEVAQALDRVMHDVSVPAERRRMISDMVFGLIREHLPSKRSPKRRSA